MKDIIILRLIGLYLFTEGIASLFWAFEPRWSFQLARFIRIILGAYLFIK